MKNTSKNPHPGRHFTTHLIISAWILSVIFSFLLGYITFRLHSIQLNKPEIQTIPDINPCT